MTNIQGSKIKWILVLSLVIVANCSFYDFRYIAQYPGFTSGKYGLFIRAFVCHCFNLIGLHQI